MNNLYPIFLNMNGQEALVVGGGAVAEQKVDGLLAALSRVTLISPKITDRLRQLAGDGKITVIEREYRDDDVRGYFLVIGTTDDRSVQERIYRDARRHGIPVNIADVPDLCDFYLGSIYTSGDLKVVVSTNGKSPTLGKIIRDRIAGEFSGGYTEILKKVGDLRAEVLRQYPDYESRKAVFENIVHSELEKIGKL